MFGSKHSSLKFFLARMTICAHFATVGLLAIFEPCKSSSKRPTRAWIQLEKSRAEIDGRHRLAFEFLCLSPDVLNPTCLRSLSASCHGDWIEARQCRDCLIGRLCFQSDLTNVGDGALAWVDDRFLYKGDPSSPATLLSISWKVLWNARQIWVHPPRFVPVSDGTKGRSQHHLFARCHPNCPPHPKAGLLPTPFGCVQPKPALSNDQS